MRWLLFPFLLQFARAQQFFPPPEHNHPAAGPDINVLHGISRDELLEESFVGRPDALVDPSGREFIAPLKAKSIIKEEEIRREAAEIARVLSKSVPTTTVNYGTWLWTMIGCALVVSCGIVPAFLLPANASEYLHTTEGRRSLNLLLSFAVGSLLGDVFLHLLPETWNSENVDIMNAGIWSMAGILTCFIVEKLCASTEESQHRVCAIMNLAANLIDNFTHGLAVGGSFLISPKFGMMTTFAILVHEIPHEISDFAILLRADYNRTEAVKAQLLTAVGGVLGACFALCCQDDTQSMHSASWVLPFTAGGFINIALAQILPEINGETDRRQNLKQLVMIVFGVSTMAFFNQFHCL